MLRFSIFIAVSTEAQAQGEKDSLPEQEKRCRALGTSKGWHEVGQPYVVPGESRTRWVNLRDAENEIPPLHQMLEDAKAGLFDILILYDYNRLRDLLDPVAKTLASYGAQIYSVNQPVEPLPPDQFTPYASDSASMMQGLNQIISRWQINDLRRKHTFGIMARARRGLHPSGITPYGYIYRGSKLPPAIDHVRAAIAIQIKDLFLSDGQSIMQIVHYLEQRHIQPPKGRHWNYTGVHYILTNPIYAGKVRLGYLRKTNDPRTGRKKTSRGDPKNIIFADGQHQGLWDDATYQAILSEMKRRAKHYKGRHTYRLSNLLFCADHGRPLHVRPNNGSYAPETLRWACRAIPDWWHVCVFDKDILARLADTLTHDLRAIKDQLKLPSAPDDSTLLRTAFDDLISRRERLTDALEQGALDASTYAQRVQSVDTQLTDLQSKLTASEDRHGSQSRRIDALTTLLSAIDAAPAFITQAPAQTVNAQLRALIEKITIDEQGNLTCHYR